MKSALSHNEIQILDRHVATLSHQLSEIADLLESRMGDDDELATSARDAEREFTKLAQGVRRRLSMSDTSQRKSDSRTA